jgi:parallel beta helix pectate lyase-like protein
VSRRLSLVPVVVAALAAVTVAVIASDGNGSHERRAPVSPSRSGCDKVASPRGSNANRGTAGRPYATVAKLANSLRPGQTGCLREGTYGGRVKITRGGRAGKPTILSSYPRERATVRGRIHVANSANHVTIRRLYLDGRNRARLPSPTVNGNNVVFQENDVTTRDTTICFLLGSKEYGRAVRTVIERNRIHDCGQRPPTNHHHGIYVEASTGARITDNWIYDNADRGVQLFPDARRTYVARNVIDGNGEGVVFSRKSAGNIVEANVIANPVVRYNVEDFELTGKGNVARRNCLWSTRHPDKAGIQPDIQVPVTDSVVIEPAYLNRGAQDFRVAAESPCFELSPGGLEPGPGD